MRTFILGRLAIATNQSSAAAFLTALREAIPLAVLQRKRFNKLNKTIPPYITDAWEKKVRAWDTVLNKKAAKKDSPYQVPVQSVSALCALLRRSDQLPVPALSLAAVKLELALEEAKALTEGVALNAMTASAFITTVVALEDQKCVLTSVLRLLY